VIAFVIGGAIAYIIVEKRKGRHCIGCPYSSSCSARSCCGDVDKSLAKEATKDAEL
jgi:hypothetical protein